MRRERLAGVVPDLVSHLPGITDEAVAVCQAEARPVHIPANSQGMLALG